MTVQQEYDQKLAELENNFNKIKRNEKEVNDPFDEVRDLSRFYVWSMY